MQTLKLNDLIPIHETFQQTIQGEGYWSGTPVDFVRLSGCPIGCPWCDTGYGVGNRFAPAPVMRSLVEILSELKSQRVVISGGEPFVQPSLPSLVRSLLDAGHLVSIETSGSHWQELPDAVWITLSPKQHVNAKFPVVDYFWERANELKLVISDGSELDFYQPQLRDFKQPVFLQPEWNQPESLKITLSLLAKNQAFRLSLQTHKLIGAA